VFDTVLVLHVATNVCFVLILFSYLSTVSSAVKSLA